MTIPRGQIALGMLAATSAAALLFGFGPAPAGQEKLFLHWGFACIAASFGVMVLRLLPDKVDIPAWKDVARRRWPLTLLSVLITASALAVAGPSFRILTDETNLLGTAFSLFQSHTPQVPHSGTFYFDFYFDIAHSTSYRPLGFPFLVYLVHVLTGYSAYNGFVVNALASAAALYCLGLFFARRFGTAWAVAGTLAMAACPLFPMRAASAGFEMVNLAMACLAFLLLDKYLEERTARAAERLIFALIFLAQCRYESVLFLLAMLPALALLVRDGEWKNLTPWIALAPLLLLPVAWQRGLHPAVQENGEPMLSLTNLPTNLGHAWDFFTLHAPHSAMALPVFVMAAHGLILGIFLYVRRKHYLRAREGLLALAALVGFGGSALAVFCFHLGDLTQANSQRFALIFLPLLAFFWLTFFHGVSALRNRSGRARLWIAVATALIVFYWPVAARNEAVGTLNSYRSYKAVLAYLDDNAPKQGALVISEHANLYLIHRYSAVSPGYADAHMPELLDKLSKGFFQEMYVLQDIRYDTGRPTKGTALSAPLPKPFQVETAFQMQLDPSHLLRLSRVRLPR